MVNLLQQNIVTELGLDALAPEQQAEIVERIGRLIFQAVLLRVLEGMTDQQKDQLEQFIQEHGQDGQALFDYLAQNVHHFNEVVEQEITKFKKDSLDLLTNLQ